MPHGFLNDGRRRGFQFERKLVEDKLVMKIHEEAGSVPNERIEIKSTDLIRHRATRECNHYILYRSVYNSCNWSGSTILRFIDRYIRKGSGESRVLPRLFFTSPHRPSNFLAKRGTLLTESKYLCTVYKVGEGEKSSAQSVKSPVVTVDLAREPTRKKTFFLSFHGLPANPAARGKSSFVSSISY